MVGRWSVGLLAVVGPMVLGLGGCAYGSGDEEAVRGARRAASHCDGPTIDTWYGETPSFGLLGHAQRQINVLGNVSDGSGVASFERSLNGGPFVATPIGPAPVRLQNAGDFNIGIDRAELLDGVNTLELRAQNGAGEPCTVTLTIDYTAASVWPMPYAARFDALSGPEDIEQLAEVVDGLWEVDPDGLHIVETGYDRLLAVGDETWAPGYEVRATVSVHGVSTWGGVGLGVGWRGHEGTDDPPTDWPVGALGWVRNKPGGPELEIRTFDSGTPASTAVAFTAGTTYVFEVRTEPLGPGTMQVQTRVWDASDPEPPPWMLAAPVDARDGSVLLIAHNADVTWQDIDVARPTLPDGGAPVDAGAPDSGPPDAGPPDAGPPDAGPTDAGPPDAGPPDAGLPDAGPPDAGPVAIDAGPPDAGPPDAGPPDAGPADAGPPDAGPRDAGPPDAGPPDAGPPDAGPPDAGPPDAGPPDAGAPDAGPPDAGPIAIDAGPPDAGPPDAGAPDAGPPDAGPPDAGAPDAGPRDAGQADAGPTTDAEPAADAMAPRPSNGGAGCACATPGGDTAFPQFAWLALAMLLRCRRRPRRARD